MKTIKDFKKDFAEELETGALIIADELSEQTIFVLTDGTIIDAKFDPYGNRCTDHRQVLSVNGYDMDDLVTIEPETATIILPDHETTINQNYVLLDLDQVYNSNDIVVLYSNGGHIEGAVIMYLLEAGASWSSAYLTGVQHEYTEYSLDEYEQLDDLDKEELFVIDDDIIVDFW